MFMRAMQQWAMVVGAGVGPVLLLTHSTESKGGPLNWGSTVALSVALCALAAWPSLRRMQYSMAFGAGPLRAGSCGYHHM
jgi:hypothetical protein